MRRARGFTLAEVLVVLVITALMSTLLFQALSQVYRLQGRFGEQLSQSQGGAMRADWLRQILQGLQPDYPDSKQVFTGDANRLEGLSTAALSAAGGAPRWLTLEIDHSAGAGGAVRYRAGSEQATLLSWDGRGRAEFAYLDDAGTEFPQWPPMSSASAPQLPAVVLLRWPGRDSGEALAATVRGGRDALHRSVELMGGGVK
jgi:prepilin-type N-terminal cleavage/methylation domain-containing protein